MIADSPDIIHEPAETTFYVARDIGYGVEWGEIYAEPFGPADWTGKRPYMTTSNTTVYLFDDEIVDDLDALAVEE